MRYKWLKTNSRLKVSDLQSRIRYIIKRYPVTEEYVRQLSDIDPTRDREPRYLEWLVQRDLREQEDTGISILQNQSLRTKLEQALVKFHTYKDKLTIDKDISRYKTFSEFIEKVESDPVIQDIVEKERIRLELQKQEALPKHVEIVYNTLPYLIYKVTDAKAMQILCAKLDIKDVCVSGSEKFGGSLEHAEKYLKHGPLFVILKDGKNYAIASATGEIRDPENKIMFPEGELLDILERLGVPHRKFLDFVKNHVHPDIPENEMSMSDKVRFADKFAEEFDTLPSNAKAFVIRYTRKQIPLDKIVEDSFASIHYIVRLKQKGQEVPKEIIDRINKTRDLSDISKVLNTVLRHKLQNEFDARPLIQELADEGWYNSALNYIKKFDLQRDTEFIRSLILKSVKRVRFNIFDVLSWIRELGLQNDTELIKSLIQEFIDMRLYMDALHLIAKFNLQTEFDVKSLIQKLIDGEQFLEALDYIKEFNLQNEFDVRSLIRKLVDKGEPKEVLYFIEEFNLQDDTEPIKLVIHKLIDKDQYDDALEYIKKYNLQNDTEFIESFIRRLVEEKGYGKVSYFIMKLDLWKNEKLIELIVREAINKGLSKDALYYIMAYDVVYNLRDKFDVKPLIQKLIDEGQLIDALYFIKKFDLQDRFDVKPLIQKLIDEDLLERALDFIKEFNLQNEFDVKSLIRKLISGRWFTSDILRYIEKFGLSKEEFGIKSSWLINNVKHKWLKVSLRSNSFEPRISIPKILPSHFKKRIPVKIKLVPIRLKDITDYRESPTRFHPYVKDHPTVYDAPYMNQPPYYGIRTDIRYYDYTQGPIIGTKPSELY